jgi:hypothetical protein
MSSNQPFRADFDTPEVVAPNIQHPSNAMRTMDEEMNAPPVKPDSRDDASTVMMDASYAGERKRVRLLTAVLCASVTLLVIVVVVAVSQARGNQSSPSADASRVDDHANVPSPASPTSPATPGWSRPSAPTSSGKNNNNNNNPMIPTYYGMNVEYTPTPAPVTAAPTSTMPPTEDPEGDILCECEQCTLNVWRNTSGTPERTCGQRVQWLMRTFPHEYPIQADACRRVAFEYPCECGGCDPSRCDVRVEPLQLPPDFMTPRNLMTPFEPKYPINLYCFPPEGQRTTWRMWNGMQVQVKQDAGVCGPGNNMFSNTTAYAKDGELYLTYANQQASEVRVTLPNRQLFGYGKYSFSVKSIQVVDAAGNVLDDKLPKDLTLGIFTWDDTDNYAMHENWNHEVDIEIARWDCEDNADVQFLVQPAGFPQMYRFFSGKGATYDQNGHEFAFTWMPNRIDWETTAGGGQSFTLSTELALYKKVPDFIQCLPTGNTEIRLNLWNVNGAEVPAGLSATDRVEVVIDKFSYEASEIAYAADGDYCSKKCQCGPASDCLNSRCTNLYMLANS